MYVPPVFIVTCEWWRPSANHVPLRLILYRRRVKECGGLNSGTDCEVACEERQGIQRLPERNFKVRRVTRRTHTQRKPPSRCLSDLRIDLGRVPWCKDPKEGTFLG